MDPDCLLQEIDESEVTLRRKPRRRSSIGNSLRSDDQRRRASCASTTYEPDDCSMRTNRSRPYSWGPVGEFFYRESLSFYESERSPASHHECNVLFVYHHRVICFNMQLNKNKIHNAYSICDKLIYKIKMI